MFTEIHLIIYGKCIRSKYLCSHSPIVNIKQFSAAENNRNDDILSKVL